jgi:hypothetical protein
MVCLMHLQQQLTDTDSMLRHAELSFTCCRVPVCVYLFTHLLRRCGTWALATAHAEYSSRCFPVIPCLRVLLHVCAGVQVWDMDIGDCVMQLRPPEGPSSHRSSPLTAAAAAAPVPLTALAVTGDGACCLCGDAQGWLSCWNLKTGQLVQRVRAHKGRCEQRDVATVLGSSAAAPFVPVLLTQC